MNDIEIEQLKRLTDNDLKITISQINVSYINNFDERWFSNMDTTELPLTISFVDENQQTVTHTGNFKSYMQLQTDHYKIPLNCETINSLVNYLNKPFTEYSDGTYNLDLVSGRMLYWTTYNGKLKFIQNTYDGYIVITDNAGNTYKSTNVIFGSPYTVDITFDNLYYINQIMGITDNIKEYIELIGN